MIKIQILNTLYASIELPKVKIGFHTFWSP